MDLVALVESPRHVCCRYRLEAFRPALEAAGHSLRYLSLPRRWWECWRWRRDLAGASVVLQRRVLPNWQRPWLRRVVRHLLYDFDDAVYCRDSYHPRGIDDPPRLRRFAGLVRDSDLVIAGNEHLRQQALRWTPAGKVAVIPTCVEPERYPLATHQGPPRLVWIGSSSTLQGLERVRPMLEVVGRACPGLALRLVCDRFLTLESLPVVPVPWAESVEASALAESAVGISWVPDDDWSRGKCGLKVLQYLAAGLPVVANRVGVHAEMVRHGETGFLADTTEEWVVAVRTLSADAALRRRMGAAGRRLVEEQYSVRVGAAGWLGLLSRIDSAARRSA